MTKRWHKESKQFLQPNDPRIIEQDAKETDTKAQAHRIKVDEMDRLARATLDYQRRQKEMYGYG